MQLMQANLMQRLTDSHKQRIKNTNSQLFYFVESERNKRHILKI
jgi:hypothetical protein